MKKEKWKKFLMEVMCTEENKDEYVVTLSEFDFDVMEGFNELENYGLSYEDVEIVLRLKMK